jgi:hypothetical protein
MLTGLGPPRLQLIDDIAQVRPLCFANPFGRMNGLPSHIVEPMLVMGVGLPAVGVSVVIPKDWPIFVSLDAGVVGIGECPDHHPPALIPHRQNFVDINEKVMEASNAATDDQNRRVIPELDTQVIRDDEAAVVRDLHMARMDKEVVFECVPIVWIAALSAAWHGKGDRIP